MSTDNSGQSDPYVFPATAGNIKKIKKTIVFLHSWYKCTMCKSLFLPSPSLLPYMFLYI